MINTRNYCDAQYKIHQQFDLEFFSETLGYSMIHAFRKIETNQFLFSIHFHKVHMENIDYFLKESVMDMKGKEGEEE